VPDVALDRLLRQEEAIADFPVDQAFRDELKNLDLAGRGRLLESRRTRVELDDLGHCRPARRDRVEALGVLPVTGKDFVALCSVHTCAIGLPKRLL
jgi:hypothetical protein